MLSLLLFMPLVFLTLFANMELPEIPAKPILSQTTLKEVQECLPSREEEVAKLSLYMGTPWSLIVVYGQRGCGKTTLVNSVLQKISHARSFIDLSTSCSPRDIFTRMLCDLKKSQDNKLSAMELYLQSECDNAADFVTKAQIAFPKNDHPIKFFVVMDSAEVLLNVDIELFDSIVKLHDLVRGSITLQLIWISSMSPFFFQRPGTFFMPALEVKLPSYSREQLITILRQRRPKTCKKDVYDNYVNIIVGALYDITRSLSDMAFTADENYEVYIAPVTRGKVHESDSTRLWKNFEPHVKKLAASVGRKGLSEELPSDDLPHATRFLLIAAYLVSFNSKASDRRFFVKSQSGRHISKSVNKKIGEGKGPKAFTLERLLHVYRALISLNFDLQEEDENCSIVSPSRFMLPSAEIMTHLEDLSRMKLVFRTGPPSLSSVKKYKMSDSVTTDYINGIADSVGFDINAHLEQYAFKK